MHDFDRSNFMRFLVAFPDQPSKALANVEKLDVSLETGRIRNILFAGMGGSAMSADLFSGYVASELDYPTQVLRNYDLPAYVNEFSLVVAISYSGNTEETLTACKTAIDRGAQVIGISSGGELAEICASNSFLHVPLEPGLPPRQALGYLFFSLMGVFAQTRLISVDEADVKEVSQLMAELNERYNPATSQGNNLANHIAQSIYQAIPVIYAGSSLLSVVPLRWQNQIQENSKAMASANVFPELNHNEIMGWEGPESVNSTYRVILLRDADESPRIKQRIDITKSILRENNILFGEVFSEGDSRLARMFSMIYTGDWATYYLAGLYEKDPYVIGSIDLLKEQLSAEPVE